MSEDIELHDMRDDHQPGEESRGRNQSSSPPSQKTGKCSSTIFRYRCAVVCLGVLCLLLAIIIRVLWLKTTSESSQIQAKQKQLELLQKTCNNVTEVTQTVTASLKDLQLRYKNLTEENDYLKLQCTTEEQTIKHIRGTAVPPSGGVDSLHGVPDTDHNNQLELLQKTITNITEVTQTVTASLKDLQLRYKNLAEYHLELQCNTEDQLETKFSDVRDEIQRRRCERESHDMKNIKQHAVDVTLDPDTAHPKLILSADGKQVKYGDTRQNLTDTPKRFNQTASVLGREGFSSGKFYYEVQVKGKSRWTIGVAKESINRKGQITLSPRYGHWTILLRYGTCVALAGPPVPLSLKGNLQRVGVFVDYDAGLVSFYDVDCWDHIYSYSHVSFTEKIYPYFNPGLNQGGNSAPLIISSVHVCPIK